MHARTHTEREREVERTKRKNQFRVSVCQTEVRLRSRITHCCAELRQLDTDSNIAVVFTRAVGLNDNLISRICMTDKKRKHLCGNRRLQDQSRCVTSEHFCFSVAALQIHDGTQDRMSCARAHTPTITHTHTHTKITSMWCSYKLLLPSGTKPFVHGVTCYRLAGLLSTIWFGAIEAFSEMQTGLPSWL